MSNNPLEDYVHLACRLVLPYDAVQHATDGTDPSEPPRMGGGNTTTSNQLSTPFLVCVGRGAKSQNIKSGPIQGSSCGGPIEDFVFFVLENRLILTLFL